MRDLVLMSETVEPSKFNMYESALDVIVNEYQSDGILSYVWSTGYYPHKSVAFITKVDKDTKEYYGFTVYDILTFNRNSSINRWDNAEPISNKELKRLQRVKKKELKQKKWSGTDWFILICFISVLVQDINSYAMALDLPNQLNDARSYGIPLLVTWFIHAVCFFVGLPIWYNSKDR